MWIPKTRAKILVMVNLRVHKSLLKASEELDCNNLLIITWDIEGQEIFSKKKIDFIPLWKWLLSWEAPSAK